MDVSDCFYQFKLVEAAAWFAFDFPMTVEEWKEAGFDFTQVYDYDLGLYRFASSRERLYPCVAAMSMGWSWALYFAQSTVSNIVRLSAPSPHAELRERMPVPQLDEFPTVTATYVDNVTVYGRSIDEVTQRSLKIDAAFKALDIPVVWTQTAPVQELESVGCVIDLKKGIVKNKSKRNWNVYLAGLELCRRSKVKAEVVEIWLGHATSLFRLRPCLLSVFFHIYRFIELHRSSPGSPKPRAHLWPAVKKEIRLGCHLVWLAQVSMRPELVSQVDAGDSADFGYAMMTMTAMPHDIKRAIRFKERWRYVPLPTDLKTAIEDDDKDRLVRILHEHLTKSCNHLGPAPNNPLDKLPADPSELSFGIDRYGLGIDTDYGQWLQALMSDGDWLKTSAIKSQLRTSHRSRADLDLPALVPPVSPKLLNPKKYKLLWARAWKDPSQHINLKEGMVALSSLKRTGRVRRLTHTTKLTLSDNLAVVLAFEKGRSSSAGMNRLCRSAASFQLGLNILWRLRHIESPRNIADGPSRLFQPGRQSAVKWIEMEQQQGRSILKLSEYIGSGFCKSPSAPPGLERNGCNQSTDMRPKVSHTKLLQDKLKDPHVEDSRKASCGSESSSHRSCGDASCPRQRDSISRSFLEVFSGSGHLTDAFCSHGWVIAGSIDIKKNPKHDVTRRAMQQALVNFVLSSSIGFIHFGCPCTAFSIARTGLRDLVKARHKERIACELAFFSIKLIEICLGLGIWWSVENPQSSMIWELPPMRRLMNRSDVFVIDFPMCAYGTAYKKPTRIITNCVELCSLTRTCRHKNHSQKLVGRTSYVDSKGNRHYVNRTELAGAYPQDLAETWASLVDAALKRCNVKAVDSAVAAKLEELICQAYSSQKRGPFEQFSLLSSLNCQIPKFQDNILFGQDSAAKKAQKKRQQVKRAKQFEQAWRSLAPHSSGP